MFPKHTLHGHPQSLDDSKDSEDQEKALVSTQSNIRQHTFPV